MMKKIQGMGEVAGQSKGTKGECGQQTHQGGKVPVILGCAVLLTHHVWGKCGTANTEG